MLKRGLRKDQIQRTAAYDVRENSMELDTLSVHPHSDRYTAHAECSWPENPGPNSLPSDGETHRNPALDGLLETPDGSEWLHIWKTSKPTPGKLSAGLPLQKKEQHRELHKCLLLRVAPPVPCRYCHPAQALQLEHFSHEIRLNLECSNGVTKLSSSSAANQNHQSPPGASATRPMPVCNLTSLSRCAVSSKLGSWFAFSRSRFAGLSRESYEPCCAFWSSRVLQNPLSHRISILMCSTAPGVANE